LWPWVWTRAFVAGCIRKDALQQQRNHEVFGPYCTTRDVGLGAFIHVQHSRATVVKSWVSLDSGTRGGSYFIDGFCNVLNIGAPTARRFVFCGSIWIRTLSEVSFLRNATCSWRCNIAQLSHSIIISSTQPARPLMLAHQLNLHPTFDWSLANSCVKDPPYQSKNSLWCKVPK